MKKLLMVAISVLLLFTGCAPNFKKQEEVIQEKDDTKEKAIVPRFKLGEKYYRTILPFKPSEARGLVINNLNTRYDIQEFEIGLMRVAQNTFDPEKYLFQEGQYLDRKTVRLWLNRKYTPEQLERNGMKEEDNIGLNPLDDEVGDIAERYKKNPIYLSHILEHNYLTKDEDGKVKLDGVVIGLALNSVYYYQKEAFGATHEQEIPFKDIEQEGKKIAEEVVQRLRKMEGLENVPITIALFKQENKSSVVPGNFFAYTNVANNKSTIDKWESVNEKYYLFPSAQAEKDHQDDLTFFLNFKQDVESYFPNFNGVIGKAFYLGDQLQELSISIPIQFYGKAEAVGFTQYVTGLVMEHFPSYISVEVSITSVNGPEALIVRKAEQDEPFVHIYN
ncbi:CamS family sex pheromone protein [Bacillus aquiflavi]|uniref:CamS family sex pheromone protein n=1 Tax=Bacillus aquiflavi TaxID=2672567 RepID=A0A6B3VZ85_9BACI|nr:CamS family sex pheromone protein [Bacillus aquiflavi]MBA4538249.1 CamS family sex pheromone protein [Bacillus aquiflavi]NEY82568.1 CamS family sex pheromone protein [Bacillus aquiflavi]UAC48629.1 CamS family sex pheromone protein [Bacillus aquiflavi]